MPAGVAESGVALPREEPAAALGNNAERAAEIAGLEAEDSERELPREEPAAALGKNEA